jgi:hypothetical protein
MHPWPLAAQMHVCPRDPNALWDRVASQVEEGGISGCTYLSDLGPPQHWAERDPIAPKQASAPKFANVQTVVG